MQEDSANPPPLDFRELFRQLPAGVLLCDEEGRIVWMNPALERLLGIGCSDVLGGDWDMLPLAPASPTGPVRRFRLMRAQPPGPHMVDCATRTVLLEETLMQVSCFTPVQVAGVVGPQAGTPVLRVLPGHRAARDPGLLEQGAIDSVLQAEVSRSRRYHNPLTVVLVQVAGGPLREVARMLRDQVRWADLIGRRESDELLLVLPETDAFAAAQLVRKLEEALARGVANGDSSYRISVLFGVAEWRRGDNVGFLLERARADLTARHPRGR